MQRIVILGTGTGVGKTWVTGELTRRLGAAVAVKPIESGVPLEAALGADAAALLQASDATAVTALGERLISPHRLQAPLSPHLAARLEGRQVSAAAACEWTGQVERALDDNAPHVMSLLIETAGGAFSPLGDRGDVNADLLGKLEPALGVLVAADRLGVLHEVRATLLALAATGHAPEFVVLSAAATPDESSGTNAAELVRLGWCSAVHGVRRGLGEDLDALARELRRLRATAHGR